MDSCFESSGGFAGRIEKSFSKEAGDENGRSARIWKTLQVETGKVEKGLTMKPV
jgi:hypothetical protein